MKKTLFVACVAILSISMLVPSVQAGTNPKGKPFVTINEQIVEVKGAVTSLQDQIDLLVGDVESIEGRLAASEGAILTLQGLSASIQALIDSGLTATLEDIQGEIDFLTGANTSLEAAIGQNSGEIAALQAEISANDQMIAQLVAAVDQVKSGMIEVGASLQGQIDQNNTLIEILQEQIGSIEDSLVEKQAFISGTCPEGSAIVQVNSDGSVVCGDAGGGSMTGVFESDRLFTSVIAQPGFSVDFGLSCNELGSEWFASSAGVNNALGWDIKQLQTSPPNHPLYPNGGLLKATNVNSPVNFITVIVTCMRYVQ